MKTQAEIQKRLRAIFLGELDRREAEAQLRLPVRCVHNHQQELDPRPNIQGEPNPSFNRVDRRHLPVVRTMGLCMLGAAHPNSWPGDICEEPIDAQRCPSFTPHQSKDELLAQFKAEILDPVWLEAHLPEAYVLLWVLEEDTTPNFTLPLWKRVLFYFLRIRIEPLRQVDPLQLLPKEDTSVQSP